ncbi:MAG: hypothetical protein N2234_02615 [Planctomycetota bacterium]|nr:hypothetical protein [Planctomycetota bacterium]
MRLGITFGLIAVLVLGVGCSGNGGGSGGSAATSLAQLIFKARDDAGKPIEYNSVLSQVAQKYADEYAQVKTLSPTPHNSTAIHADVQAIDPAYAATISNEVEVIYIDTAEKAGNANLAWENHFKTNSSINDGNLDQYGVGFAKFDNNFGGGMKRYFVWVVVMANKN